LTEERSGSVAPSSLCYKFPMPRLLPLTDFRARRLVLVRRDFGYAPKPALRPSEMIDKETWDSIVTLPDDVMLDAGDDFQAATYNVLTGFYRLSVAALRSALEVTMIGAWAQVCGKHKEFRSWRSGKLPLSFGQACDGLCGSTARLQNHLRATVNDSLFDQRNSTDEGGFARRIFSGVSNYTHARPGHTDSDMRESNGPIYVKSAFNHVAWMQFEVMGLCLVLLLIARPKQHLPAPAIGLLEDVKRVKSRVTRAAFEFLYPAERQK
jgi:hypothetical protein